MYGCSMMIICMYACMHLCMYACMHVCTYVCMHVCVCMYACMYVCMHACMHVCMCVCMYLCIFVSLYLGIFVSLYLCMYIHIHMYFHPCIMSIYKHNPYTCMFKPRGAPVCSTLGGYIASQDAMHQYYSILIKEATQNIGAKWTQLILPPSGRTKRPSRKKKNIKQQSPNR